MKKFLIQILIRQWLKENPHPEEWKYGQVERESDTEQERKERKWLYQRHQQRLVDWHERLKKYLGLST